VQDARSQAVHFICESDSLAVMDFVMGRAEIPWNLQETIQRCQQVLLLCKNISVTYCPREANKAADWLVRIEERNFLKIGCIYPLYFSGIF